MNIHNYKIQKSVMKKINMKEQEFVALAELANFMFGRTIHLGWQLLINSK
jgi:hypothetical protein